MVRAGEKINLNSPSQVKQALVKLTGDESITSTSEKFLADKIAAYEETMTNERLPEAERKKAEERFNVLKMLIDFRGFDKAVSSYGENYIRACDANGRIHANFKQIEAETGRMASGASKKGEPKINLQNVPRDAETRGCFTAPLRRKLLIADFSTIELRILAEMSKDPKFIRAFSKDLHKYSASVFFKVPYEAVDKDLRQKGKNCGFAMVYGAGPFRISQITGGSKEDAAESLSNYRAEFKGNARWLDAAQKQARFQGYSRTLAGRLAKFNSGYIWNEQKKAEARGDNETAKKLKGQLAAIARNGSNSPIQGSSADLTKRAMYLAAERFEGHDVFLVNVVHDEIVCECDERIAEWAAEQLKQAMEQAGREFLTVVDCPVDVHIGDSWAEKG
jgi:DNA polymerase I-like protein with 3'-5' exonuclease and polymerase domains